MRAGILAVGSELLGADRMDSNSLLLAAVLRRFGVALQRKTVVGDELEAIADELRHMTGDLELVLVTGGLGPTADDVTREATAGALGRRLLADGGLQQELRAKFDRFGLRMPEVNLRQAQVVEGAEVLANPRGTAPGLKIEHGMSTLFLFPGVPNELRGLIDSALVPWLRLRAVGQELETRVLRVACLAESALEETIRPIYEEFPSSSISLLASMGEIEIRLTVGGPEGERRRQLEGLTKRLQEVVGRALYSTGAVRSLEEVVGRQLVAAGETVATAESCTGGLLAERLTRVAGSSRYFLGGVVAYADEEKERLLAVAGSTLERHGAVSPEVVLEMAAGARQRLESDWGVAISGIAGPGGGSDEKPVGTVHVAVDAAAGATHRELHLPGDRQRVRWFASQWSLDLLRRRLLERAERP